MNQLINGLDLFGLVFVALLGVGFDMCGGLVWVAFWCCWFCWLIEVSSFGFNWSDIVLVVI